MSTLIITLPATPPSAASVCDVAITDAQGQVVQHTEAPLAVLPSAAGAEIVALVPVQQLSWHRLRLPKGTLPRGPLSERQAPRLRSVLDGLLEDRLLDEPAQLHYALEPQASAERPIWVAACDRAWLGAWLTALEQAGRPVARVVPEHAPPATEAPATLQVTGSPEHPWLVHGSPDGLTLLPLTAATAALLGEPQGEATAPALLAEPAVATVAERYFRRPATLQTRAQRTAAAARSAWDLAQFDLQRTRGTRVRKHLARLGDALLRAPQWRAARWALAAMLLAHAVGLVATAWHERADQAAKRAAIRAILTETFPDVRVVIDAPLQMARSLAELQRRRGTASSADLETMLVHYQAAAPNAAVASGLEFSGGELRLKGLDPAAAALVDVVARLGTRGYSARWQDTTLVLRAEGRP